jgi:hypothetical protein
MPAATFVSSNRRSSSLSDVPFLIIDELVLEFLHEMPYCATAIVPMLKVRSDGYYEIPGTDAFPLSFSLLAGRPR